jgi:hypothetical protein
MKVPNRGRMTVTNINGSRRSETQEGIKEERKKERKKRYISKRLSDALYSEFVSFSLPVCNRESDLKASFKPALLTHTFPALLSRSYLPLTTLFCA